METPCCIPGLMSPGCTAFTDIRNHALGQLKVIDMRFSDSHIFFPTFLCFGESQESWDDGGMTTSLGQLDFSSLGQISTFPHHLWINAGMIFLRDMHHMAMDQYLYITIFRGMNIHKSQLFWCELQGYYWFWHTAIWSPPGHGSMASRLHLFWTKPLRRGLRQIVAPWGASTASTWHGFAQSWGPSGDVGWQMGWFAQAEWVGTLWLCQT